MNKKIKGVVAGGEGYWNGTGMSGNYKITKKKNGDIECKNKNNHFIIKERYVEKIYFYDN